MDDDNSYKKIKRTKTCVIKRRLNLMIMYIVY